MKTIDSVEYNLNNKLMEMYDSTGEIIGTFNPLKVIKESFEPKACYLISNMDDMVVFDKSGRDIMNIPIQEIVQVYTESKLEQKMYEKYLGNNN